MSKQRSRNSPAGGGEQGVGGRAEERLRMALQVSRVGTWTRDLRTGEVEWSPELADLFGIQPGSAPKTAEAFFDLVHPDDRAPFAAAVEEALRSGRDYDVTFRYRHSSGEFRWMTGRGRAFFAENGEPVELAGVGIEITDQERARQIAEERSMLLQKIGDNLPQGALYQARVTADGGREFLYWSAGIEELIGLSPAEAVADAGRLYRLLHPEDAPKLEEAERKAIESSGIFDATIRIRHSQTGEWRWVHLRSAPRTGPGVASIWDGIYLDVTAQKHAEEQLTSMVERLDLAQQAGHIGVFDWDIETGRLIWTEEEQRLFGLGPGEFEGTIESWSKRLVPEDAERMQREMAAAMERREPQMRFAFRIMRSGGAIRWIEGAARFSYAPDGRAVRMVGVNIDVTERRDAEAALQVADRRKTEFLAMLSHELRNPLAAISNALELCETPDAGAATMEWARIVMRRQMLHITRLVDDLLDVTRITGGKIQLRRQTLDAVELLEHAIMSLRPLFAERDQALIPDFEAGPLYVNADPTRLEQVLTNLLTNASKYTPQSGKIWVSIGRRDDQVVFTVRDNGIGIPPENLSSMFELFAQGKRSIARSEGGLGIGLTIARTLIEMHGGRIAARSEGEGKGSEFTVSLPEVAASEGGGTDRRDVPHAAAAGGARVLVVDDHVDTATSLVRLLKGRHHVVKMVHDGAAAISAAESFRPEVVLLDLGLPGIDGYSVAEQIRSAESEGERATIIAISGYGQEEDRRRSAEAGIDHHLVKPVRFADLERLITRR